jgi:hypothetical protein
MKGPGNQPSGPAEEGTRVIMQSPDRSCSTTEATEIMVALRSVSKAYGSRDNRVAALTNVTVDFPA